MLEENKYCNCMCHIDVSDSLKNNESTLELKQQISELQASQRDLLMIMGDLSFNINKQHSEMREFEKQIVQPMRDQIEVLEKQVSNITERMNKRVNFNLCMDEISKTQTAMQLLEKRLEEHDELHAGQKMDFNWHTRIIELDKRIEVLENNLTGETPIQFEKTLIERVEALEASNAIADDGIAENAQAIKNLEDGLCSWRNDAKAEIFKDADNQIDNLRSDIAVIRGDLRDEMKIIDRNAKMSIQELNDKINKLGNSVTKHLNTESERIEKLEQWSDNADKWMNDENLIAWQGAIRETNEIQKNILNRERDRDKRIEKLEQSKISEHNDWKDLLERIENLEQGEKDKEEALHIMLDFNERLGKLEKMAHQHVFNGGIQDLRPGAFQQSIDEHALDSAAYLGVKDKIKTKGLTFEEALAAMKKFKKVKRSSWTTTNYYYDHARLSESSDCFSWEDLIATDWEILN